MTRSLKKMIHLKPSCTGPPINEQPNKALRCPLEDSCLCTWPRGGQARDFLFTELTPSFSDKYPQRLLGTRGVHPAGEGALRPAPSASVHGPPSPRHPRVARRKMGQCLGWGPGLVLGWRPELLSPGHLCVPTASTRRLEGLKAT